MHLCIYTYMYMCDVWGFTLFSGRKYIGLKVVCGLSGVTWLVPWHQAYTRLMQGDEEVYDLLTRIRLWGGL